MWRSVGVFRDVTFVKINKNDITTFDLPFVSHSVLGKEHFWGTVASVVVFISIYVYIARNIHPVVALVNEKHIHSMYIVRFFFIYIYFLTKYVCNHNECDYGFWEDYNIKDNS